MAGIAGQPLASIGQGTQQAIDAAKAAGFSGLSLVTVIAIARAESGLNPNAQNTNTDGSLDRGILQFNSRWHPEVTDSCAYNVNCAFQAAYRVSNQGRDFSPWATYTNKQYAQYLSNTGALTGVTIPDSLMQIQNQAQGNALKQIPVVGSIVGAVQGVTDPLASLTGTLNTLTNPTTWVRVGLFLGAIVIVIIGFTIVASGEMSK